MHLQPSSSPHRNSIAAYCCCCRARRCGKTAVSRIVSRAGSLPFGLRSSHCNHSYGGDNAVCEVRAARKTLLLYHYSALAAADVSSLSLCKSQFPAQSSVTAVAVVITVKGIVGGMACVARHCGCNSGSAAVIKLMQSSYPTSQAYTTARERWRCSAWAFPICTLVDADHCWRRLECCRFTFCLPWRVHVFSGSHMLAHYTICRSTNIHSNRGMPWRTARLVNS
jgi:hypothetical protein